MTSQRCACGQALHYGDPGIEARVQETIDALGPTVDVPTALGTWVVPRHYYALHGIVVAQLPELARRYHWERLDLADTGD